MKYLTLQLCLCALAAYGQSPTPATPQAGAPGRPSVPPDTVVLKVNGKPLTAAQFNQLLATFAPDIQQQVMKNPQQVMQSYFLMQDLEHRAEADKLDQTSPVKEQLALQRMQTLAMAVVSRQQASITVSDEDSQKRYEADRDKKYQQAKVRAVFVQFADPKAINAQVDMGDPKAPKASMPKGLRSESEAKAIAEDVTKVARSGGDFAAMAKEKSDDKKTAANGGEFPMIHGSDRIPEELKKAIFALQAGEVSDPVRAPNGFYVFKLIERGTQPYDEVKQVVANEVRTERFQKWMTDQQKQFEVSVESPTFFGAPTLKTQSGSVGQPPPATPPAK